MNTQREVARARKEITDRDQTATATAGETVGASALAPPFADESMMAYGRSSPLAGLEFKQARPIIKGSDLDLERHTRKFRAIIDRHALTRQAGVRPYDILVVFRRTLAPGSTRLKVYETEVLRP